MAGGYRPARANIRPNLPIDRTAFFLEFRASVAGVAELVDALVLGTSGFGRGGSSPFARTRSQAANALSK
jgi:hypothetical protein